MSAPLVSVIVVHYNTPGLTIACVQSVIAKTTVPYEVIVIDNASTVGNIDQLNDMPGVRLIRSGSNLGFAGGNNLGIANSKAPYVLLLNSDCELGNNAIDVAMDFYQINRKWLGALSSSLHYPDGRPQYPTGRFPSLKSEWVQLLRMTKSGDAAWMEKFYLGDRLSVDREAKVDWIWGAFFLMSREKVNTLSGNPLPETFFLYYEDVQWCYELAENGWSNYYYPKAQVMHHLSGSGGGGSEEEKYWQKIQPNEYLFLKRYKGLMYTFLYYLVKGTFYLSLRKANDVERGKRFLRIAFTGDYR